MTWASRPPWQGMPWLVVLVALVAGGPPRPVLAGERSIGYVLGGGTSNMMLAKDLELAATQTLLGSKNSTSVCELISLY